VSSLHALFAWAVIGLNLAVGVWGLRLSRLAAAGAGRPRGFQYWPQLLAAAQTAILAEGLFGLMLLGQGDPPSDHLHQSVYGPFMVVAYLVMYGMRTEDQPANLRNYAVCGLIVAALGVRAVWTG
jgi:hypothetical protein